MKKRFMIKYLIAEAKDPTKKFDSKKEALRWVDQMRIKFLKMGQYFEFVYLYDKKIKKWFPVGGIRGLIRIYNDGTLYYDKCFIDTECFSIAENHAIALNDLQNYKAYGYI